MSFRLNICPQHGLNGEVWVRVYAEPTPKLEHCIPCTDELLEATMPRLETLVMQVYEAGKRDGRRQIQEAFKNLMRASNDESPYIPPELYTPRCPVPGWAKDLD